MTGTAEEASADDDGDRAGRDLAAEMREGMTLGEAMNLGAKSLYSPVSDQAASGGGEDVRLLPIEELSLTVRSYTCLKRADIHTVSDVIARSEDDLLSLPGFGAGDLQDLKQKLAGLGLVLKPSRYPDSSAAGLYSMVVSAIPPRRQGAMTLGALHAAGMLLPGSERARWLEEWANELAMLKTRRARARVACSLLFSGIPTLAVTLRRAARHPRSAWPES